MPYVFAAFLVINTMKSGKNIWRTLYKGFKSFNAKNLRSLDKGAAKLLAVKVRALKKKSAVLALPKSVQACSVRIRVCPGSNHSQSLMACNCEAL